MILFQDLAAPDARRALRAATWGQCFGVQPQQALSRGIGLLYLYALGLSPAAILVLLSASVMIRGLLSIPAGFLADRMGKKRVGVAGQGASIVGFALLTLAGGVPEGSPRLVLVTVGILLFGTGTALFGAGWIALLSPLLPADARGRLLGQLRFARQLAAVVFGGLIALWMTETTPLVAFQALFALLTLCLMVRLFLYRTLPELEHTGGSASRLLEAIRSVLSVAGYRRTCMLICGMFFTVGGVPMLFGLLAIEVLGLGDDAVWWLGVAILTGHLVGALAGGALIDATGGRRALVLCQLGFAVSLLLLIARGLLPAPMGLAVGASIVFGLAKTTLEIATATELIRLVPRQDKALAISTCMSLVYLADSLAGLMIAALLPRLGTVSWSLPGGLDPSPYDLVLVGLIGLQMLLVALTAIRRGS